MKRKKPGQAQHIGIFWLVHGKLLLDSTLLSEAEPYGNHRDHPRSHIDVWEQFQRLGKVPADVGYDEPARGRVMFDRTTETFMHDAQMQVINDDLLVNSEQEPSGE